MLSLVKVYVEEVVFVPLEAVSLTTYSVPNASPEPIVNVVSSVNATGAAPLMLYVPDVALLRPTVIFAVSVAKFSLGASIVFLGTVSEL